MIDDRQIVVIKLLWWYDGGFRFASPTLQIFGHGQYVFMHGLLKLRLDKFVVFFGKRDIYQKRFFWRYLYIPEQG